MRGKLAKKLRKAAREMSPGWAERAFAELNGTRRRRVINGVKIDADKPPVAVTLETFTAVNHPTCVRSRYRLLKRAYMKAKYDHV